MRITTIADEKNLDQLLERIGGSGAAKDKDVRRRLLQANPHLAEFEKLPAGTPVIVPGDSSDPAGSEDRLAAAKAQAQQAIDLTRSQLDDGIAGVRETVKATSGLLSDPRVQEALRANSEEDRGIKELMQEIKTQDSKWQNAAKDLQSALTGFANSLGTSPAPPDAGGPKVARATPSRSEVKKRKTG